MTASRMTTDDFICEECKKTNASNEKAALYFTNQATSNSTQISSGDLSNQHVEQFVICKKCLNALSVLNKLQVESVLVETIIESISDNDNVAPSSIDNDTQKTTSDVEMQQKTADLETQLEALHGTTGKENLNNGVLASNQSQKMTTSKLLDLLSADFSDCTICSTSDQCTILYEKNKELTIEKPIKFELNFCREKFLSGAFHCEMCQWCINVKLIRKKNHGKSDLYVCNSCCKKEEDRKLWKKRCVWEKYKETDTAKRKPVKSRRRRRRKYY